MIQKPGLTSLDHDELIEFNNHIGAMQSNLANIRICSYTNKSDCSLQLDPQVSQILRTSRDPEELKYYWVQYYNLAGASPVRKDFDEYVRLVNKGARLFSEFFFFLI